MTICSNDRHIRICSSSYDISIVIILIIEYINIEYIYIIIYIYSIVCICIYIVLTRTKTIAIWGAPFVTPRPEWWKPYRSARGDAAENRRMGIFAVQNGWHWNLPSGKHTKNDGKPSFIAGKIHDFKCRWCLIFRYHLSRCRHQNRHRCWGFNGC